VHIEDAAAATTMALECRPGAYNIVDADPTPQRVWPSRARSAHRRRHGSRKKRRSRRSAARRSILRRLRGASNEKAKRELNFQPRPLKWMHPSQPLRPEPS